jgi:hypothetical protein
MRFANFWYLPCSRSYTSVRAAAILLVLDSRTIIFVITAADILGRGYLSHHQSQYRLLLLIHHRLQLSAIFRAILNLLLQVVAGINKLQHIS